MRAAKERAKMVEQVVQMEKKMQGEDELCIFYFVWVTCVEASFK